MAEIKKRAKDPRAIEVVNKFWQEHIDGKEHLELGLGAKHFSFQVPKGVKGKKMQGMVKFRFNFSEAWGPAPLEIVLAVLAEAGAKEEVSDEPRGPIEREISTLLNKR